MNPVIAFINVEFNVDVQACFVELLKSKTLSYKDEEIDLKKAIFVATTVDFDELPYALAEQMIEADTPGYASTQKTLILKEKMIGVFSASLAASEQMIEHLISSDRDCSGLKGLKSKLDSLRKFLQVEAAKGNVQLPHVLTKETIKMIVGEPTPLRPLVPDNNLMLYISNPHFI